MGTIFTIALWTFGAVALLQGVIVSIQAQSVMHQIYGGLSFIVSAVCLSGLGVMAVIAELPTQKTENMFSKDATAPEVPSEKNDRLCPLCKKPVPKGDKICPACFAHMPGV